MNYRQLEQLVNKGDYQAAVSWCQNVIDQADASTAEFWRFQLALIHFLNFNDSETYYQTPTLLKECIKRDPENVDICFWYGWVLEIVALNMDEARDQLEHCLALQENHPYAHLALAGEVVVVDERIHHLRRTLEVQPNNVCALRELGELLIKKKEFREARDVLGQIIENEPYVETGWGIMNRYVNGVLTGALSSRMREDVRELLSRLPADSP